MTGINSVSESKSRLCFLRIVLLLKALTVSFTTEWSTFGKYCTSNNKVSNEHK
jgi:hypothetical protein